MCAPLTLSLDHLPSRPRAASTHLLPDRPRRQTAEPSTAAVVRTQPELLHLAIPYKKNAAEVAARIIVQHHEEVTRRVDTIRRYGTVDIANLRDRFRYAPTSRLASRRPFRPSTPLRPLPDGSFAASCDPPPLLRPRPCAHLAPDAVGH